MWKDEVSVQAADPKKILKPREAGSEPWTDPDFPPTMENMGKQLWEKKGSPGWTRLPEIFDNPKLFDEEDPFDIRQGGLGNCWLIAVLASLGEYQPYLRDHIFLTKDIAPDGRYQFRLYDIKVRDWVIVEVDDFVPCHQEKSTMAEIEILCPAHAFPLIFSLCGRTTFFAMGICRSSPPRFALLL